MSPAEALAEAVAAGRLEPDPDQAVAADRLSGLTTAIAKWRGGRGLPGFKPKPPKGLYLWGGVGTGKSLLMDLFFEAAPIAAKRRVHFHQFMLDVHGRIAGERAKPRQDPLPRVADQIAKEARLLCFDELQVSDVADAMILGRLFERLFQRGVVVVATSNRRPEDLYKDGLNRQLFLPFIDLIQLAMDVVKIGSGRDYRLERLSAAPVYYTPLGPEADAAMDQAFERLTMGAKPRACTLTVQGRPLEVPAEAAGVARYDFTALCGRPLGAADYLLLAQTFHTLMVDRTPMLGPENRNEAKRFVTLIDALYETRTKLVISAAAEPDGLYPTGDGAFEFERTASRLYEMRSHEYLAAERRADTDANDLEARP